MPTTHDPGVRQCDGPVQARKSVGGDERNRDFTISFSRLSNWGLHRGRYHRQLQRVGGHHVPHPRRCDKLGRQLVPGFGWRSDVLNRDVHDQFRFQLPHARAPRDSRPNGPQQQTSRAVSRLSKSPCFSGHIRHQWRRDGPAPICGFVSSDSRVQSSGRPEILKQACPRPLP